MAVNKPQSLLWPRLHFLVRVLGLAGLLAGLVVIGTRLPETREQVEAIITEPPAQAFPLYISGGLAALALLVEVLVFVFGAAVRRSAGGTVSFVQAVVVLALLVGVNVWSFRHHWRFDWTRNKQFTLPKDLREELSRLDKSRETTVIVYQRHKTFGALTDKPDRYDYAAERKVVEKVRDLAELLREVGPALRVEVLDVEEEGFEDKLARLTKGNAALRKAIDDAPENSIFITGAGHVQQMSFNEFYQLDRNRSKVGNGNLVLLGQGEEGDGVRPFVNRILTLEQRRPVVGILVIHELLSTEGADEPLTLSGLRKSLQAHGFDTRDVILKKWQPPMPTPDVLTLDEGRLTQTEARLRFLDRYDRSLALALDLREKLLADLRKPESRTPARIKEIAATHAPLLRTIIIGGLDASLVDELIEELPAEMQELRERQVKSKEERASLDRKMKGFDLDALQELRQMGDDIKAKLAYSLAGCDMLLVPRITRMTASPDEPINPRFYNLSEEQSAAVREALKAGKPLLACLGPTNEKPRGPFARPETMPAGPDGVEKDLETLGFRLGKTTVLFDADTRAFLESEEGPFRRPEPVETPPLDFRAASARTDPRPGKGSASEHPLRRGLGVMANSVEGFSLKLRFARPVYFERDGRTEGTFLVTAAEGWNEADPYPIPEKRYVPEYTPGKADDAKDKKDRKDKLDARRRGPMSVAAAAEVGIPAEWGGWVDWLAGQEIGKARVAVIGQGEAFTGSRLQPARERLLLQTVNWLLGRDDYLPTESHQWKYPRLPESKEASALWLYGVRIGLPVLFAFLGIVVLLYRRLR